MVASASSDSFQPPLVVVFLERPLSFLRGQYSTDFSDVVSKELEVQEEYKDGLVGLACFLGGILLIWGLLLVFFMIKGGAVGCASGRAFETRQVDQKKKKDKNDNDRPISATDSEEDDTHSHHDERDHDKTNDGEIQSEQEPGPSGDEHEHEHEHSDIEEDASFQSSLCSSEAMSRYDSDTQSQYHQNTITEERSIIDTSPRVEGPRAMRTRIVFFVFALTVLACIPLALAFAFAPMKETVKSFDGNFDETDDFIASARAAASTVSTASQSAMGILSQTSTNFSSYCPNVNQTESDTTVLGVNLQGLSNLISNDYISLQMEVTDNMTKIENMLQAVEEAVEILETSFHHTENIIWLVPGLLLGVSILTALATFGVILAWKQESGPRLQCFMSYGVLPALIAACILCCLLAVASSVSSAASADFCLGGLAPGSPDTTIHNMLIAHGDYPNTTKYQFLTAYTSGCEGLDPTRPLVQLERESQNYVDDIWQYIAEIDQVGRSVLSEECGGSGLDELLSAARNIAKLLTKVRRALDSMSDGLTCERIHPLYERTVHGSICTDLSEATAWSTIIFSLLGVALMIIITLRASWRLRIDDDRIYHHESEVAENMIVNEHEEYLRYISKYKHEWQEYGGFGGTAMRKSESASFSGSEGDPEEDSFYSRSGSGSQTTDYTNHHDAMDMHEDLTSVASGDISFPSLQMPPSDDSSVQNGVLVPMPPSILTGLSHSQKEKSVNNKEMMLFQEAIPPSLGRDRSVASSQATVQLETNQAKGIEKQPSTESEESTDFSSIGVNARRDSDTNMADMSPTVFWRHQIGLGIEVAISQNEDSLALSPNSESGLDSLDLTKTPSPRKNKAIFDDHLANHKVPIPRNVFPDGLYAKDSSDDSDAVNGIKPVGLARMRTEPYTLKPRNSHLSVATEAVATNDAKEERRASLLSPGSVQFQDDGSEASPTHVQKQVTHFSKAGPLAGRRKPVTPNRSKKSLSTFLSKAEARSPDKILEDLQTH